MVDLRRPGLLVCGTGHAVGAKKIVRKLNNDSLPLCKAICGMVPRTRLQHMERRSDMKMNKGGTDSALENMLRPWGGRSGNAR